MPINELQLPAPVVAPQINWSPLDKLGDAVLDYRKRQALADAIGAARNPDGTIDAARAGTAIMSTGDISGGVPLVNLGATIEQRKQQQANADRQFAESVREHNQSYGLQGAQLAELRRLHDFEMNKPVTQAYGSSLVSPKGELIRGPDESAMLPPDTIDQMARQLQAGDTSVLTNLGRGAQGAQNVVAVRKRLAELNANRGETGAEQANRQAEFFGAKAANRTVANKGANIELAATEFNQVLPVVLDASKAVDRTQYSDLNKVIQAFNERTGDPNIVKFGGAVNTLVNLYARAISPTGVSTVSDKDHARILLNKAWSTGQFDAAVGMMQQEISAALNSPEKVRDAMRKRFLEGVDPSRAAAPGKEGAATPPPAVALPKITSTQDANRAIDAARRAVAAGVKTPDEANALLRSMGVPPLAR